MLCTLMIFSLLHPQSAPRARGSALVKLLLTIMYTGKIYFSLHTHALSLALSLSLSLSLPNNNNNNIQTSKHQQTPPKHKPDPGRDAERPGGIYRAIADSEGAAPIDAMDTVPVSTMERVGSLFERVKRLGAIEAQKLERVLPLVLDDFFPPRQVCVCVCARVC